MSLFICCIFIYVYVFMFVDVVSWSRMSLGSYVSICFVFIYVAIASFRSLVIYWVVRSMCIYGFRYLCMSLCMRAWLYLCMCVFMYCCIPLYYLFSSFVWVVRSFLLY